VTHGALSGFVTNGSARYVRLRFALRHEGRRGFVCGGGLGVFGCASGGEDDTVAACGLGGEQRLVGDGDGLADSWRVDRRGEADPREAAGMSGLAVIAMLDLRRCRTATPRTPSVGSHCGMSRQTLNGSKRYPSHPECLLTSSFGALATGWAIPSPSRNPVRSAAISVGVSCNREAADRSRHRRQARRVPMSWSSPANIAYGSPFARPPEG